MSSNDNNNNNNNSTSTSTSKKCASEAIPNPISEENSLNNQEFLNELENLSTTTLDPTLKKLYSELKVLFEMFPEEPEDDENENSSSSEDEETPASTITRIERSKPKLKRFADKLFVS